MKVDLQQIYNEFAETYDKNRSLFDMSEVFQSFFERFSQKNGRILDIGCGAGESFSKLFVEKGWDVTGVDFSEKMVELATKYVPEMTTIHADMRHVSFEDESFDAITAIYSLFHLPSGDQYALFENFYRWLTPGGKVLFTYATVEYTGSKTFDGYKEFMGKSLYYGHKTPERLQEDLEKIGFTVESRDYRTIGGETFLWLTCLKR